MIPEHLRQAAYAFTDAIPDHIVVDVETTVRTFTDEVGSVSYDPMPYGPAGPDRPRVLIVGTGKPNGYVRVCLPEEFEPPPTDVWVVGHNLKFDHQHFLASDCLHKAFFTERFVWDTMIAEYILTAQQSKFISLDALGLQRLGRGKTDLIGARLSVGITPDKIDPLELGAYCAEDITLTAEIFARQWRAATPAQRALIAVQSAASIVYGTMEFNVLPLNTAEAVKRRDAHSVAADAECQTMRRIWEHCLVIGGGLPKWWMPLTIEVESRKALAAALTTPRALSAFFFGVPAAWSMVLERPAGVPGRGKTFSAQMRAPVGPLIPSDIGETSATLVTKGTAWRVDEDVLGKIATRDEGLHAEMAAAALAYRHHSKLANTYYQSLLERQQKYGDDRVHHTIHSTSTNTGRTSSANPNLQNQPPATREVFQAPDGWTFIEADFSQLEVMALAQLSKCPSLQRALLGGSDLHFETGKDVFGWRTVTESKADVLNRTATKRVVFGLLYGGGSITLAQQSGFPVDVVRKLIDGFYSAFPGVETWHDQYYARVTESPDHATVERDPKLGCTVRHHTMTSQTGRLYQYRQTRAPDWIKARTGCGVSFMPTAIKNYPVQGLATGDWVPLFLVLLADRMREAMSPARLVNAVHDSVLLEVPDNAWDIRTAQILLAEAASDLSTATCELWEQTLFKQLELTIKTGTTWSPRSDE